MALFDALFEFSDNQAITGDIAATHNIDMQAADLEMGAGTPIYLNIRCGTTFDSGTDAATLVISLVNDSVVPIDVSSIKVLSTRALAVGDPELTAGGTISFSLPVDFDWDRQVGIWYEVGGGENFTAGNLDAWWGNASISSSYDTQVASSNI